MDVIYTNNEYVPQGVLNKYDLDLDTGKDNDFEISMPISRHCMGKSSLWYVEGTEFGGIVDGVRLNTETSSVYYYGRSWRGILQKKIVEPETGQDYYTVSGDANDIIEDLILKLDIDDVFTADPDASGITISSYTFDRYTDAYSGILKMLSAANAKLEILAEDGKIYLGAVARKDLSNYYEYSDDYGMMVVIDQNSSCPNHLICLGQGVLHDRTVEHLFLNASGEVTQTQYYFGGQEISEVYDYPNAENATALIQEGTKHLLEQYTGTSMSAAFGKLDVDIGDIVGGKNRATGMTIKDYVTSMIVNISNGSESITYKVGDNELWEFS